MACGIAAATRDATARRCELSEGTYIAMNDRSPNVHTDEIVQRQLQLLERVVRACLGEASRFTVNPDSLAQEVAVALNGTIVELAHAC